MSYKPRGRGGNRGGGTDNRGGRGGGGGHQSGSGGYQGCGISGSNYRGGSGGGHGGGGHRDFRSLTSRPQQAPGGVFELVTLIACSDKDVTNAITQRRKRRYPRT